MGAIPDFETAMEIIADLERKLAEANARIRRLSGILTGTTRQETADKIFAATSRKMNTRSVWILADELMQPLPSAPESEEK
jgi:hypothetical protein